jgi:small-conductance mechanosensitive channel
VELRLEETLRVLLDRLVLFAPRLATALALLVAAWLAAVVLTRLVGRLGAPVIQSPEVSSVLSRTIKTAILAIGVVSALGTLGINVMGMVAGLGLAGFALGFALKDALSNALSGILILVYRPFRRGDRVAVTGFDGEVTDIDLRYTTLRLDDGRTALVPNASIFTNPLVVKRHAVAAPEMRHVGPPRALSPPRERRSG